MLSLISALLKKLGQFIFRISRFIYIPVAEKRVTPWFECCGDQTLRLEYDLDASSVVLDLGAFDGQWASDIFSRYLCKIYCFEPHPEFCEKTTKRFRGNHNIQVYCFGLGPEKKSLYLSNQGTSSSLYHHNITDGILIDIRSIEEFLDNNNVENIDLMKINIEGAEYELLEHMLDSGLFGAIVNLQVQFHDFIPGAEDRMDHLRRRFAETHTPTYMYDFVWESWERK